MLEGPVVGLTAAPSIGRGDTPVLGLLVDCIDDSYQNHLVLELSAAAHERGASLLCFAGGVPGISSARNRIYDFVKTGSVDALIVCSGTLESGVGRAAFTAFFASFHGLPKVSVGIPIVGVPSVLLDNLTGTEQVVLHLSEGHQRRRIAFIRGPTSNEEAEQRFAGYRQALAKTGIPYADELCVSGNFLFDSGEQAVRQLLDERKVQFDAIVAANDGMALGALQELKRRGIAVPESVAIAGFDDEVTAQNSSPPLTTVRQPIRAQAKLAVDLALRELRGVGDRTAVHLPVELVKRRSCGCPLDQRQFAVEQPRHPGKGSEESPLLHKRDDLIADLQRLPAFTASPNDAEALVDAFLRGLRGRPGATFASVWEAAIQRGAAQGLELRVFHAVTTALRQGVVPSLTELGSILTRGETLLHESRVLLAQAIQHHESQLRVLQRRTLHILGALAQSLITCTDRPALLSSVTHTLTCMGIPAAFIALDRAPAARSLAEVSYLRELALALCRAPSGCTATEVPAPYPAHLLIPRELLALATPRTYIVESLFYGPRWLGVALFELGPVDGSIYEALRAQLSAGLEALDIAEGEARSAALRRDFLERATSHSEALDHVLQSLIAVSGNPSELPLALDALSALAAEWSSFVGRERETLRAPPVAKPSVDADDPDANAR